VDPEGCSGRDRSQARALAVATRSRPWVWLAGSVTDCCRNRWTELGEDGSCKCIYCAARIHKCDGGRLRDIWHVYRGKTEKRYRFGKTNDHRRIPLVVGVHVQLQQTFVKVVVNGSRRVNWATKTIDLVPRTIHKPDLVTADAKEPFDTFSKGLSAMGHVVLLAVAVVGSSVGTTAGAAVVVGHRISTVILIVI